MSLIRCLNASHYEVPHPLLFLVLRSSRAYRLSPHHVPATRTDAMTSTMQVMWVTSVFLATYFSTCSRLYID